MNPHFCILPWVHAHVLPTGNVVPCCYWPMAKPLGNLAEGRLADIRDNDAYREMRRKMLNGEAVAECATCYHRERDGVTSARQQANEKFARPHQPLVAATGADGALGAHVMAYFDMRFSNVCNFKCRGCIPDLSSAWHEEHGLLWNYVPTTTALQNVALDDELRGELRALIPTVEEAYFAGGEPLLMLEHYDVLDEFVRAGKTAVSLTYNTNLSTLVHRQRSAIEYWNRFANVYLGISIDVDGKRGEYFRKGMNWDTTIGNAKKIRERCPHVRMGVNCTVSLFNVLRLPELHTSLVCEGVIDVDGMNLNVLVDPPEYSIQVLSPELKLLARQKLESYVREWHRTHPDDAKARALEASFHYVLGVMEAQDRTDLLPAFRARNQKLDELRGESFVAVFPELADLYDAV